MGWPPQRHPGAAVLPSAPAAALAHGFADPLPRQQEVPELDSTTHTHTNGVKQVFLAEGSRLPLAAQHQLRGVHQWPEGGGLPAAAVYTTDLLGGANTPEDVKSASWPYNKACVKGSEGQKAK